MTSLCPIDYFVAILLLEMSSSSHGAAVALLMFIRLWRVARIINGEYTHPAEFNSLYMSRTDLTGCITVHIYKAEV